MVRSPLLSILTRRLPAPLVGRYRGDNYAFWIDAFNSILGELEQLHTGKGMLDRAIVPWRDVAYDNPIPDGLASVDRAWKKDGEPVVITSSSTGFTIDSEFEIPTGSEAPTAEGFIAGYTQGSGRSWIYGDFNSIPAVGMGVTLHESSGMSATTTIRSWMIQMISTIYINPTTFDTIAIPGAIGQLPVPAVDGDNSPYACVWDDFLVVEGARRLDRAALVSDLSPLPPEYDDILASGLRAYGEIQTDQDSRQAADWMALWERAKKRFSGEMSRQPDAQRAPVLRRISMPGRF